MKRRSYKEYCGIAKALDVVGERWTLLIVRNLLLGPLRYTDLLRGLPGITTNLLAKRLREMETAGLIEQVRSTASDAGHAYRLLALGQELEPAVQALGRWGWRYLGQPAKGEGRNFEWLLIALRREYRGGADLRAELIADGVPYSLVLSQRQAEVGRGSVRDPELRIRGTGRAIAQLFLEPNGANRTKGLEIQGPAKAVQTLTTSFALPPRAVN